MDFVSKTVGRVVQRAIDRHMGAGLMQEENTAAGERWFAPGFPELIRRAGAEAILRELAGAGLVSVREVEGEKTWRLKA